MDLGIRGKAALVTAASKGMGKATAMGLAAEGVKVLMCARTAADIKAAADEVRTKTGTEVVEMTADITKKEDIERLVTRANEAFGGVDILVANSGGPQRGNLDEMTDEQWISAFEISTLSVVRMIRGVLPSMKKKRWGRILTIQSVSVKQPVPGLLLSNSTRPGVAGMAKTLSEELGKHNITINVVCPGKILTDRLLGGVKQSGLSREEYLEKAGLDIPLGRVGTAEEFANVMVFLASERASYVTGVAMQVDGGLIRSNV
jgi:3-oxoacyl-[acyl-carrier protein] reductase